MQSQPRFSLPVLLGVLLAHVLVGAWMVMAHVPPSPAITPPVIGILLSDPSSAGENRPSGTVAGEATAAPALEKTGKRPPLPVTKKQPAESRRPESPEKTATANKATGTKNQAASESGNGIDANAAGNTGPSGSRGESPGAGSFFSPRVDAPGAHNPKPRYPVASRKMGEEGMVTLSVHVLSSGQVADVRLKKSSGYPRLDDAAIKAVKNWRYFPARQGNTPVACWHTQAVKFSLTD